MTDEKIKKYFLGELSKTEAENFEEICAQDTGLTEQVQMVESELIDDYLRENLSTSERKLFETNYLTTEVRSEKVKFAKGFFKNFDIQQELAAKPSVWQNLFGSFQMRFAVAAILLLSILGGVAFLLLNRKDKSEIVQGNTNQNIIQNANQIIIQTPTPKIENQTPTPNSEKENLNKNSGVPNRNVQNGETVNKPTPTPEIKPTPTPEIKPTPTPKPAEQPAPILASFTLLPGTLRSEGEQSVKISAKTAKVNFRLSLPKDANKYQTYNAVIKTADGNVISTFSNLKSLNLNLPADKLEKRTYIIFVEGNVQQKKAESVAEYTFRVNREK